MDIEENRGKGLSDEAFRISAMPIDGVRTGLFGKGQQQHMEQVVLPRVAELGEADGHFFMTEDRLGAVGAEDAVPPGEVESEIAVCFADGDRVMHPVHIRGDHQQPEIPVEFYRQFQVAVVEHGSAVQDNLKDDHGQHRGAEGGDDGHFDDHADQDFNGMKAQAGGDIDVQIGMMHHVQAPEQRHRMEHDMLEIDHQIQDQDADKHAEPGRQIEDVEEPPAILPGRHGHLHPDYGEKQPHGKGINRHHAQVAEPSDRPGHGQRSPGREEFTQGDNCQNPEKKTQSNRGFLFHGHFLFVAKFADYCAGFMGWYAEKATLAMRPITESYLVNQRVSIMEYAVLGTRYSGLMAIDGTDNPATFHSRLSVGEDIATSSPALDLPPPMAWYNAALLTRRLDLASIRLIRVCCDCCSATSSWI